MSPAATSGSSPSQVPEAWPDGVPAGKPSRPAAWAQEPSEAVPPGVLLALGFPAVLMLHGLAALAVARAAFAARADELAARPAPGSHAWIISDEREWAGQGGPWGATQVPGTRHWLRAGQRVA